MALPDSVRTPGNEQVTPVKRAVTTVVKKVKALTAHQHAKLPAGAFKASLPVKLSPQLATLADSPPEDGTWLYELKFDGYRLMARLGHAAVNCFTRNGHDWTAKLPQVAQSLAALSGAGMTDTWLDGEIVALNDQGIPDFQMLQKSV